jgi:hypothetical protein
LTVDGSDGVRVLVTLPLNAEAALAS